MDGKIKFLDIFLGTALVRAGSNGEDVIETQTASNTSAESVVDCDERSFSLEQELQVPNRKGNYEFRISGFWWGGPDRGGIERVPGVPYTPDSHVFRTWKAIVE